MKKTLKRALLVMTCAAMAATSFAGCGGAAANSSAGASTGSSANSAPAASNKTIKVAMLTATGGLGDKSFNDTCWEGFQRAQQELGVEIKVVEPQSVTDYPTALTSVAEGDFDFIMAVGNDWVETINDVAPKYPDKKFGAININCTLDNVAVASFSDFESGYLAGVLAAKTTKSNKIGYIGGMDVPAVQRFLVGYNEGAAYANPDVQVISTFVGSFADPGKGQEFALQLMSQGVDVIYHGAGKSGEGLFNAIKDAPEGVYAIGCDSNQDAMVEGRVLASTLKRVDVAAYTMIENVINDKFQGGVQIYNLANGGISLSDMAFTKGTVVSDETVKMLDETIAKIIAGDIKITDSFIK